MNFVFDLNFRDIANLSGPVLKTASGGQNCVFGAVDSPGIIATNLRDSQVKSGHAFPQDPGKNCAENLKEILIRKMFRNS